MADLLLDDSGDLPIRNQLVTGRVEVAQRVAIRVNRFLGEWFLNTAVGLPFEDWLAQKPPDVPNIVAQVRAVVGDTRGVVATQNFEGSQDTETRTVTITGEYLLDDGTVEELLLVSDPTAETGNAAYWDVAVRAVTTAPIGAYYSFGGSF